jgi:hypothetical protein
MHHGYDRARQLAFHTGSNTLATPLAYVLQMWDEYGNLERLCRRNCAVRILWTYRVIKKSLCIWWLQYRKLQVMFKVSPASLQTFIDTRLTLTPSVTPNSNYVIIVSYWNCLKYFCFFFFLYRNHQVHRDFLITLYFMMQLMQLQVRVARDKQVGTGKNQRACWEEIERWRRREIHVCASWH